MGSTLILNSSVAFSCICTSSPPPRPKPPSSSPSSRLKPWSTMSPLPPMLSLLFASVSSRSFDTGYQCEGVLKTNLSLNLPCSTLPLFCASPPLPHLLQVNPFLLYSPSSGSQVSLSYNKHHNTTQTQYIFWQNFKVNFITKATYVLWMRIQRCCLMKFTSVWG